MVALTLNLTPVEIADVRQQLADIGMPSDVLSDAAAVETLIRYLVDVRHPEVSWSL